MSWCAASIADPGRAVCLLVIPKKIPQVIRDVRKRRERTTSTGAAETRERTPLALKNLTGLRDRTTTIQHVWLPGARPHTRVGAVLLPLLSGSPAWAEEDRRPQIHWSTGADWPTVTTVPELGESPRYFREPHALLGLGLRPSLKGMGRLDPPADYRSFVLAGDLHLAGRFGLGHGRSIGLWPEVGYLFSGTGGHYASAGLGLGSQTPAGMKVSFGLVPRGVFGWREGSLATGVRTSVLAELYFDDGNAWGLELCHQWTRAGGIDLHELGAGISLTWLAKRWD